MKRITAVFAILFLFSCESFEHESEFDKSYQKWQSFKSIQNNSYRYVVTGGSWTGVSWETEIVIQNGEIVERSFKYTSLVSIVRPAEGWNEGHSDGILEAFPHLTDFLKDENINMADYLEWTERKVELGTHVSSPAASLWTLDQIYSKAKEEWLSPRDNVTTYFETKNDGLISTAGFVDNNCADDCFVGVSIKSISKY